MKTTLVNTLRSLAGRFIAAGALALSVSVVHAASITGDPSADSGWSNGGNSLANGTYVRGEGTFSFDIYSATFAVEAGSNLEISAGQYSWLAGDTIIGLGGKFVSTDAATAGWPAFIPNPYSGGGVAVNDDVSGSSRPVGKWGTSDSNFTTSTTAPFQNGNGNGSQEAGHGGNGSILMRITANRGSSTADMITLLDRVDRYDGAGTLVLSTSSAAGPNQDGDLINVGRMIYKWNGSNIASWEYLLNTSLLAREFPYASYPVGGDQAILAVQRSTNRYTDGLINTQAAVPEPASLALLGLGGLGLFVVRRRRQ